MFQSQFRHHKEVEAAQGVKIVGKDLDKVMAGLPMYVAKYQDEVEVYKVGTLFAVAREKILSNFKHVCSLFDPNDAKPPNTSPS